MTYVVSPETRLHPSAPKVPASSGSAASSTVIVRAAVSYVNGSPPPVCRLRHSRRRVVGVGALIVTDPLPFR